MSAMVILGDMRLGRGRDKCPARVAYKRRHDFTSIR